MRRSRKNPVLDRAERRLVKLLNKAPDAVRERRAEKHRKLCADVVKEALAFYRDTSFIMLEGSAQTFNRACAALERFETGKKVTG